MEPRIIVESRLKTLAGLAFFAALTGVCAYVAATSGRGGSAWAPWLGVLGGLGVLEFGWLLARPMKLRLDAEGFALSGGFYLRPERVAWRDVDRFAVAIPGGRSGGFSYVQYAYLPGHERPSRAARLIGLGRAPGSLPGGWPVSAPDLAQLLNDYCWEATHAHHHQGASP